MPLWLRLRPAVERLGPAMEDWFRRKGYIGAGERVEVTEHRAADAENDRR